MGEPIETVANRLYEALSIRNMRPIDLSEKTGIPKSSISQYLSGYTEPKADRIYLLAKALNVEESWLIGYDVPMDRRNTVPKDEIQNLDYFYLDKDRQFLIESYNKLSDTNKKLVAKMISELAKGK